MNTVKKEYIIKQLYTEEEKWQCFQLFAESIKENLKQADLAPASNQWLLAAFQEVIEKDDEFYAMFDKQDKILACVRIKPARNELGYLYISPQADREHGVGCALLKFTEKLLGFGAFLWVWEHDYKVESLFQQNGWYFSGQQKEETKVDNVFVMKKLEFFGK